MKLDMLAMRLQHRGSLAAGSLIDTSSMEEVLGQVVAYDVTAADDAAGAPAVTPSMEDIQREVQVPDSAEKVFFQGETPVDDAPVECNVS